MAHRIEKFNSAVKRELGAIMHRELEFGGALVTVIEASGSDKMGSVRISVVVFPQEKTAHVVKILNKSRGFLKKKLNDRFDFGRVPELIFIAHKGLENAERVERALEKIERAGENR